MRVGLQFCQLTEPLTKCDQGLTRGFTPQLNTKLIILFTIREYLEIFRRPLMLSFT